MLVERRSTDLTANNECVNNGVKRLLSINNYHYRRAGSDALFLDQDRLFQARGWQTAVFSMKHRDNLATPWQEFFVDELEFGGDYSLPTRLRLAGKVLYSREARANISRLLDRYSPDVVHIHSIYHHISPAILPVLGRRSVPIVMTAHDYKLLCPAYKMYDGNSVCEECRGGRVLPLIRKRCLHGSAAVSSLVAMESVFHRWAGFYERHIDRLICPSRFMFDKFVAWGWPSERLVHLCNFFDERLWTPSFQPGRYFLYFGRLAPEKGLATFIRAAAQAKSAIKIVGWGAERNFLQTLADQLHVAVEFIDHVPPALLASLIGNARAVVVPSEWYENASLAILESFASGKPVIAAGIGGIPEMVIDGDNGWLFPPGDAAALASRLDEVASMPDSEVESFGRRARLFVERHYSADRYFAEMTRLYADLGARERLNTGYSVAERLEPQAGSSRVGD
ncbi:MAG: group 1 glycosyl transferase [Gammaproteobacteria bacterium]|nr:MAG: group 1 glycosyl transferase [Gammaproteobacteria bacterium]TND04483.1 MAG: group 1 glycosyl transferase [Gammaproteobacteria bacterium]